MIPKTHYLYKIGTRHDYLGLNFWAEEGVIIIEDKNDGHIKCRNCRDFYLLTKCMYDESKRAHWQDHRDSMNKLICEMFEVWKEAKEQGDPSDPKVVAKKVRERRKASMVTGMWN